MGFDLLKTCPVFSGRYCFATLIGGCILLAACERDVPKARLPDVSSKLAVTCFISPQDTLLEAFVFQSFPMGSSIRNQGVQIENAAVTLSDGSRSVVLPFVKILSNSLISYSYRIPAEEFPIETGKTYFLKISVPDGRSVEAQCTVPAANNTLSVRVDSGDTPRFGYSGRFKVYRYTWLDAAGKGDYYRVAGDISDSLGRNSVSNSSVFWDNGDLTTDAGRNGTQITVSSGDNYSSPQGKMTLYAYLLTVDEAYYRYHDSVRKTRNADGNPFAEPVLVYSNMKNGLGVFAAFNRHTLVVKLK